MGIKDLEIADVRAWGLSFPVSPENSVRLGVGQALKRDAVVVKVTTKSGIVGWGESHHGRAPSTIAHFINFALRPVLIKQDASNVNGIWQMIYKRQLAAMGIGAGCAIAMSGIDMALWDIRAKAVNWPLYKLLGGSSKDIPAYAGGVALGWQEPEKLVEEAAAYIKTGYKALKLRLGEGVSEDLARIRAIRLRYGDELTIMGDANCAYTLDQARQIIPALDEMNIGWLEEPFPAHDYRNYEIARSFGKTTFAAGENHYTRFEFNRLVDGRAVTILQPDLSKTGGITESLKIAALGSSYKLPTHPHTCMTGINMAATIHFLAAIDQSGYFEADVSKENLFRDSLVKTPFSINEDGCVAPSDLPGIGVEVDENFIKEHPVSDGPAYA